MLTTEVLIPPFAGAGSPALVLLHGRGADEHDLLGLVTRLPTDAVLVFPRGPFSGADLGYGGGWAWYQFLGGNQPEASHFERSMEELDSLVDSLPATIGFKPGAVFVGGFSQGGTTALGYALGHRARIKGVLMLSGFLADHPAVARNLPNAAGLPVFWGHGTQDPMMPFSTSAQPGRDALQAAGAALVVGDYPIGHSIDPRELADASAWFRNVVEQGTAARESR